MKTPIVFISYCWDSESHKDWVLNLANSLINNGIDVILDQYDLSLGKEMTHFMEKALTADKILIVMTPNYKLKADERSGGVGYEYSMITQEYYEKEPDKLRIFPILRGDDPLTSCPVYMKGRIFHDMRKDDVFDAKLFELIRAILNKPTVIKPAMGKLPDFNDKTMPDIDKTLSDFKIREEFVTKKRRIIDSEEGTNIFLTETNKIINQITLSIENYKKNFGLHFYTKVKPDGSIHFATSNFTFYVGREDIYANSASDAKVNMNFFHGIIGFDDLGIWSEVPKELIYQSKYKFDLDENFNPIFIKIDNLNVILNAHDLATVALREVITNELKVRAEQLE